MPRNFGTAFVGILPGPTLFNFGHFELEKVIEPAKELLSSIQHGCQRMPMIAQAAGAGGLPGLAHAGLLKCAERRPGKGILAEDGLQF